MFIEVFNPAGRTSALHGFAPRVPDLAGRRIGILSNGKWQAHRTLPLLAGRLRELVPDAELVMLGDGLQIAEDSSIDFLIGKGVDCVVVGNAA